jgi:hypothetical protein
LNRLTLPHIDLLDAPTPIEAYAIADASAIGGGGETRSCWTALLLMRHAGGGGGGGGALMRIDRDHRTLLRSIDTDQQSQPTLATSSIVELRSSIGDTLAQLEQVCSICFFVIA